MEHLFPVAVLIFLIAFVLEASVRQLYRRIYGDRAMDHRVSPIIRKLFPPPDPPPARDERIIVVYLEKVEGDSTDTNPTQ